MSAADLAMQEVAVEQLARAYYQRQKPPTWPAWEKADPSDREDCTSIARELIADCPALIASYSDPLDRHYCGCCGNEADQSGSGWCDNCFGHVAVNGTWEKRTYFGQYGRDCPFQVDRDAPSVWDPTVPPGGFVCGDCGMPVESEPCPEHQPEALRCAAGGGGDS